MWDAGVDTGMVWVEIRIDPCGVELPQIHPGFTELSYILQGALSGTDPIVHHDFVCTYDQ